MTGSHYFSRYIPNQHLAQTLWSRCGVAGWHAWTEIVNTWGHCPMTLSAFLCSAAAAPNPSQIWSSPGSNALLTVISAPYFWTPPLWTGWLPCGPAAIPRPISDTWSWTGQCPRSPRWTSCTPWTHRTPGSCGAAFTQRTAQMTESTSTRCSSLWMDSRLTFSDILRFTCRLGRSWRSPLPLVQRIMREKSR